VLLYVHELRMAAVPTTDSSQEINGTAVTISMSGFIDCITAAHNSLDAFLSLELSVIRSLPTSYFVRITHTAILLVKLQFAATGLHTHGDSKIKADYYVGCLIKKFSGWDTLWPAQRLAHTLRRLRGMLQHRGNEGLASELAWLNVWTLEETPSVVQGLENAGSAMLSTFDEELLAWSLSGTGTCNVIHSAPPSTSLDATQLVDWFGTDLDTSTFDFDGNLQIMTQYFD
jgi:hypothetical protein